MRLTKRDIVGIFLLFFVGLLALGAWRAFFMVMVTPGVSDIWQPMPWFALLATFFFLGTAVWKTPAFQGAGSVLLFIPGFFFIVAWEYVVVSVIAMGLVFWSATDITHEFKERLHFRFFRSIRAGQFFFVAGLALSLSGGYYVFLKQASWEELVPRFRIGEEMTAVIFKTVAFVNPSFATLAEGDATVDEFLLSFEVNDREDPALVDLGNLLSGDAPDTLEISPEVIGYLEERGIRLNINMSPETKEMLFLQSGREQIAGLAGRPVEGNEKISDILSIALQRKLIGFLGEQKTTEHIPSQAVPFFLALLLFFTLLPVISILGLLCILMAELLFVLSLRIGWLALESISVEQKRLVE